MLCAFCIRRELAARTQAKGRRRWVTAAGSIAAAVLALILSWTFFYVAGQLLGRLSRAGAQ